MEVRLPINARGVTYPFILFETIEMQHINYYQLLFEYSSLTIKPTSDQAKIILLIYNKMFQHKSNNTDSIFNSTMSPTKLWVDSEITGKFIAPQLSFSKEKRFKWSSIYWPQNNEKSYAYKQKNKSQISEMAKKVSKLIDDQQKNEARIQKIKRNLSMSKSQLGSGRKESFGGLSTKKAFKLSKINQVVVNRLTINEAKMQSTLRDRHGNRCNLFDDPQQLSMRQNEKIMNMSKTTGFSTSRKIKLELPHNYFPGPGTYEIKRYLSQLDKKSETPINAPGSALTDRSSK